MTRKDFNFTYNSYGYMVQYKGKNIGGAGVQGKPKQHWQHERANLIDNKCYAEVTIRDILRGGGSKGMKEQIQKIDKEIK